MTLSLQLQTDSLDEAIKEYKLGKLEQSKQRCLSLLEQNPNHAGILYLCGVIYQKFQQNDTAIEYINKAISIDALAVTDIQQKLYSNESVHTETGKAESFEATRKLLNQMEKKDMQPTKNKRLENVLQKLGIQSSSQPTHKNVATADDRSQINKFFQSITLEELTTGILFFPGVNIKSAGNITHIKDMIFVQLDELYPTSMYVSCLINSGFKTLQVMDSDTCKAEEWDAIVIPFSDIETMGLDTFLESYKFNAVIISDGLHQSPDQKEWNEALSLRGLLPDNDIPELFRFHDKNFLGEALFNDGKIEDAIDCFEKIIQEDPNNITALNNLAVISYDMKDLSSAEILLKKTLAIDPNHLNAMLNLADIYMVKRDADNAALYLKRAVETAPKDPTVWESLGLFYKLIGSEKESKGAFIKCEMVKKELGLS